jgi:phosphoglycerate dehydrogenase-like enzyme
MARRLVVDLAATRPVWRAPAEFVAGLREGAPAGWEVVEVAAPVNSDGDGSGGSAEAVAVARGAEVYIGYGLPPGILAAARDTLRWVHSAAAGVSASLGEALASTGLVFTNSAGVHAEPMAEWAAGAVLHFFRGIDRQVRAQAAGRWGKDELTALPAVMREVAGARAVVYGLGGIGSAVARRLVALGAAALDVFAEEPLPAGHPFWAHPRVLICPHASAVTPRVWERQLALVRDNWARLVAGRELRNRVDLVAGY